jgi:hypothetical protein
MPMNDLATKRWSADSSAASRLVVLDMMTWRKMSIAIVHAVRAISKPFGNGGPSMCRLPE